MLSLSSAPLLVPALGRRCVRHAAAAVPRGAFVLYRYQKPQDPLQWWLGESTLPSTKLRSIDPTWLTAATCIGHPSSVETRERIGESGWLPLGHSQNKTTLRIPGCVDPGSTGAYGDAKLVPGTLVNFKTRVVGEVMYLNGIVRSVSKLCMVKPIALYDYQPGLPAADQPFIRVHDGPLRALPAEDLEVARKDIIDLGSPEMDVHRSVPLAASALFVHPISVQKAEVLIDGRSASEADVGAPFWPSIFTPRSPDSAGAELGVAATEMGLVRSRADIRLDDEVLPILLVSQQADGSDW